MTKSSSVRTPEKLESEIKLGAISPVVYSIFKVGDVASIKRQAARKNEYRDKIPKVDETLLVFRGITKIGMIPRNVVSKLGAQSLVGKCRIVRMSKEDDIVAVALLARSEQKID